MATTFNYLNPNLAMLDALLKVKRKNLPPFFTGCSPGCVYLSFVYFVSVFLTIHLYKTTVHR